jgi:hypothetical protein
VNATQLNATRLTQGATANDSESLATSRLRLLPGSLLRRILPRYDVTNRLADFGSHRVWEGDESFEELSIENEFPIDWLICFDVARDAGREDALNDEVFRRRGHENARGDFADRVENPGSDGLVEAPDLGSAGEYSIVHNLAGIGLGRFDVAQDHAPVRGRDLPPDDEFERRVDILVHSGEVVQLLITPLGMLFQHQSRLCLEEGAELVEPDFRQSLVSGKAHEFLWCQHPFLHQPSKNGHPKAVGIREIYARKSLHERIPSGSEQ